MPAFDDSYQRMIWRDPRVDGRGVVPEIPLDLQGFFVNLFQRVQAVEDGVASRPILKDT